MEKNYVAQLVIVKNKRVYEINCNAKVQNGKIWIKSQNAQEKEYQIKHICSYSNEKLVTIKEEFDFSFSMLMSFASAIFMQLSLILSLVLLAIVVYDLSKKTNFKYIILQENTNSASKNNLVPILQHSSYIKQMKRAA